MSLLHCPESAIALPRGSVQIDWISMDPGLAVALGDQALELMDENLDLDNRILTLFNDTGLNQYAPAQDVELPAEMQTVINEVDDLHLKALQSLGITSARKLIKLTVYRGEKVFPMHSDGDFTYTTALSLHGRARLLPARYFLEPGKSFTSHAGNLDIDSQMALHGLDKITENRVALIVRHHY